jgi:hypothetical protein
MRISYCIVLAEKKEIKIQSTIPAKCVILFLYYPEVKNPKSNYPNSQTACIFTILGLIYKCLIHLIFLYEIRI